MAPASGVLPDGPGFFELFLAGGDPPHDDSGQDEAGQNAHERDEENETVRLALAATAGEGLENLSKGLRKIVDRMEGVMDVRVGIVGGDARAA